MQSKKLNNPGMFLLACIIAGTIGCKQGEVTTEETVEIVTPVTLTNVSVKQILETVELPGTTNFIRKSIVKSATTGVLESNTINIGMNVRAGELLFKIKTREATALEKNVQNDSGFQFNGLINIICPVDGIITSVSHQTGDNIQEGDELAVISQQNSLVFVLEVPYELNNVVRNNKNCQIILPDNSQIKGEITGMLPEMDSQSQTVRYMVRPITNKTLPENLIAYITLIKREKEDAIVLPKTSVLGNETQTEFWVMKLIDDSTAIKVPVVKGYENSEEIEIIEPVLSNNDRILLTGGYGLPDTAQIAILN
jgi:hypothetical protein